MREIPRYSSRQCLSLSRSKPGEPEEQKYSIVSMLLKFGARVPDVLLTAALGSAPAAGVAASHPCEAGE